MNLISEERAILRIAGKAYLKEMAGMKKRSASLYMVKMYNEDMESLESAIEKLNHQEAIL